VPRKALNETQAAGLATLVLEQQNIIDELRAHNERLSERASRMALTLLDLQWINHDREDHVGAAVSRCKDESCRRVAELTHGLRLPF
jgi:hypothetical protein